MHEPPHFPRDEADLADWSVYADHLIERGDPRGELIARDLALSAHPTRDELAAFQLRAKPLCPTRNKDVAPAWTLGFIRELHVQASRHVHGPILTTARLLENHDATRFLETFAFDFFAGGLEPHWRELFAALPASCATVAASLYTPISAAQLADLIAWLPPTVRTFEVRRTEQALAADATAVLVTDRFDLVDVSRSTNHAATPAALASTRTVRLRVRALRTPDAGTPRVELCAPGDARLAFPAFAVALQRTPLVDLQQRHRIVGVRAQLARALREGFEVYLAPPGTGAGTRIVRHGDRRWTVRGDDRDVAIDGVPVALGDIRDLPDGAALAIDGVPGRFTAA